MEMDKAKSEHTLRQKISHRIQQTEIPFIVYPVVLVSKFLLWRYRTDNKDIAMNFFAELFGAAVCIIKIVRLLNTLKREGYSEGASMGLIDE
jgi:hypothetical protein